MDDDIDISGLNLDDKVAVLMRDLPEPVQNFLKSSERNEVSLQLSRKYNLHADAAGVFEKAYIFMLLGVHSPDQFVQELRDGGISEDTIKGLATDVNELVFKKLREQERTGAVASVTPIPPARPQVPVMGIEIKEAMPAPAPPQPVALPPYIAPAPVYQTPTPVPVSAAPIPNIPIYSHPPVARTMESDMELAAQDFRPGPENQTMPASPSFAPPVPAAYIPAPVQAYAAPIPQPQPAYTAPVPPPQPTAPASSYPPPAMAPVRLTPVERAHPNAPITKEYGSDPYREVIE